MTKQRRPLGSTMTFDQLIKRPASWMVSSHKNQDIVLTSRIRLARNLKDLPFPGWARKKQRIEILSQIMPIVSRLDEQQTGFNAELSDLDQLQKQLLVERHLISRELAARSEGCGISISRNQSVSILLNEEDHLRLQCIMPGLQIRKAWEHIRQIDHLLGEQLPYASLAGLGYLTACPTNLGTGMRASVMVHLPGMVLSGYMDQVFKAAEKLNITVRGIYGEGTDTTGNIFQFSNISNVKDNENTILDKIKNVISDLSVQETNAREKVYRDNPIAIKDRIGKSYGILKFARLISTREALEHISMIRMGISLGVIANDDPKSLYLLVLRIQAAHIQQALGGQLPPEMDKEQLAFLAGKERADTIREHFKNIPEPNFNH